MKTNLAILALVLVTSFSASAQEPTRKDPLLDRLTGSWILQGTIAGHETTHDIESEWVLSHEYVRLHETSREKNIQGQPAYEAIVFIEWDESSKEYRCLWLDSTAGGGLSAPIAQGKRGSDEIAFLFRGNDKDSGVHTQDRFSNFSRLSTGSSKRKYASTEDRANENACGKIYAIVSQPARTNQTPLLNIVHSNRNQGCTVNSRYEDGCPRVVPWSEPPPRPRHGFPCAPLNCHGNEHSRG